MLLISNDQHRIIINSSLSPLYLVKVLQNLFLSMLHLPILQKLNLLQNYFLHLTPNLIQFSFLKEMPLASLLFTVPHLPWKHLFPSIWHDHLQSSFRNRKEMEIVTRSFTSSSEKGKSTCSVLLCHFNIFWDNDPTTSLGKFCQILKGTNLRSLSLTTFFLKFQPIILRTNFASQLHGFWLLRQTEHYEILSQELLGNICIVPVIHFIALIPSSGLFVYLCSLSKTWGLQLLFQFLKKKHMALCNMFPFHCSWIS